MCLYIVVSVTIVLSHDFDSRHIQEPKRMIIFHGGQKLEKYNIIILKDAESLFITCI